MKRIIWLIFIIVLTAGPVLAEDASVISSLWNMVALYGDGRYEDLVTYFFDSGISSRIENLPDGREKEFYRSFTDYLAGFSLAETGNWEDAENYLRAVYQPFIIKDLNTLLAAFKYHEILYRQGRFEEAEETAHTIIAIPSYNSKIIQWTEEADLYGVALFSNEDFFDSLKNDREHLYVYYTQEISTDNSQETEEIAVTDSEEGQFIKKEPPEVIETVDYSGKEEKSAYIFSEISRDEGNYFIEFYYPYYKVCGKRRYRTLKECSEAGTEGIRDEILEDFLVRKDPEQGTFFLQLGAFVSEEQARDYESCLEKSGAAY